jgi:hypothetical protein
MRQAYADCMVQLVEGFAIAMLALKPPVSAVSS